MKAFETASIAKPFTDGDKLYQRYARTVLPILVRQAQTGMTIYYSDLASELGMKNPRNLNYVLGSVGRTLNNLSLDWAEQIPPIQCLVVTKGGRFPETA